MLDYTQLQALVTVVRERSFQQAAKVLFVTQSAVSQRVRNLELKVGAPLLVRANPIRATPVGQKLINHYHQVVLLEQSIETTTQQEAVPVPLPVAVNAESLSTWFLDAVEDLLKEGRFVLEIWVEDQEKTLSLLQEGKVIGCVSSTPQAPPGCVSVALGTMRYRCVCHPSFRERYFSEGLVKGALSQAPAAIYGEFDDLHSEYLAQLSKKFRSISVPYTYVPSAEGLVKVVRKGLAYAVLPELSIYSYLKKGTLMDLVPDKPYRLPLFWQSTEVQTPIVEALSQSILRLARQVLSK